MATVVQSWQLAFCCCCNEYWISLLDGELYLSCHWSWNDGWAKMFCAFLICL